MSELGYAHARSLSKWASLNKRINERVVNERAFNERVLSGSRVMTYEYQNLTNCHKLIIHLNKI